MVPETRPLTQLSDSELFEKLRMLVATEPFREAQNLSDELARRGIFVKIKIARVPPSAGPLKIEKNAASPVEDLSKLEFTNPGLFYTACFKKLGLPKSKVDILIAGLDLKDLAQRQQAWQKVIAGQEKKEK